MDIQELREFVDEFYQTKESLENILNDISDKDLKEFIEGCIDELFERLEKQKNSFEERIDKLEDEELKNQSAEFDFMRL